MKRTQNIKKLKNEDHKLRDSFNVPDLAVIGKTLAFLSHKASKMRPVTGTLLPKLHLLRKIIKPIMFHFHNGF